MKNVLLTGGAGFLGSNLVNNFFSLVEDNVTLTVLDRLDYSTKDLNISPKIKKDHRYKLIQGDLCDSYLIKFILEEYQIDTVIHLAAQTHVDISFGNSLQFTHDNILGTHTLLEECRKYGKIQRFIHFSTDEVYGEVTYEETSPCTEKSLLMPTNPYSATKAAAEMLVRSYGCSYKLPYIIIRANNIYGPRQFPDKLIPKFILLLYQNKKLPIQGNGSAKRTFVHVLDIVKAIFIVITKGEIGEIYNIGSKNEFSVMEITKELCRLMDKDFGKSVKYVKDRNFQDRRYLIDYSKTSQLGWQEEIIFDQGLKDTLKWYLKNIDKYLKLNI